MGQFHSRIILQLGDQALLGRVNLQSGWLGEASIQTLEMSTHCQREAGPLNADTPFPELLAASRIDRDSLTVEASVYPRSPASASLWGTSGTTGRVYAKATLTL
ncbi:hypothetical protein GJAV_G00193770 [Gymnothorax javanicus]|nr:hypothetical protein GJAV_G00193770 [Gymnothorax javanicus]